MQVNISSREFVRGERREMKDKEQEKTGGEKGREEKGMREREKKGRDGENEHPGVGAFL